MLPKAIMMSGLAGRRVGDLLVGDARAAHLRLGVDGEVDEADLLLAIEVDRLVHRRPPVGAEVLVGRAVVLLAVAVEGVAARHLEVGVGVDGDQVGGVHCRLLLGWVTKRSANRRRSARSARRSNGRRRGQEHRQCADVLGRDETLDRLVGQRRGALVGDAAAAGCGTAFEHTLDAWAFDGAGQDRVDTDAELAEFARQRLRQADQAPLARRIRAAVRVAKAAGQRGHDQDRAIPRALQVRDRSGG